MKDPSGLWASDLGAGRLAAASASLAEVAVTGRAAFWLASLPAEGGRVTLMKCDAGGRPRAVLPAPYSVNSRVNEYGGGGYAVCASGIWFVNGADQGIYRCTREGVRLVCGQDGVRFGDLAWDGARRRILAVAEDHRGAGPAAQRLVAVSEQGGLTTLAAGADFYAAPRPSPDATRLAWLEWSDPDMPWDATRLRLAAVTAAGALHDERTVAGQNGGESLAQPRWSPAGELYAVTDRGNGYWNLHRLGETGLVPVRRVDAECARPAFVLAENLYAFTPEGGLLLAESQDGQWRLLEGSREGTAIEPRLPALTDIAAVAAGEAGTAVLGAGAERPLSLFFRPARGHRFESLASAFDLDFDPGYVSRPERLEFRGAHGGRVHALYFGPAHPRHRDTRCRCVRVRCHGGPTSSASWALEPKTLFWTSRGFGALELDYRGSSGYGRSYREGLYGAWGVADVEDACSAAGALVESGLGDPRRLVIAGGSAGGLTVLLALTGASPYAAGASHYGVADLVRLMEQTHRFEAHYGEKLVGPWPAARALYERRSPLARAAEISRPVIFFQGLEDPVVPPEQSERMARALASRGLRVAYETFPGERHGFRRAETVARTLGAELAFYAAILGLDTAETLATPSWLER